MLTSLLQFFMFSSNYIKMAFLCTPHCFIPSRPPIYPRPAHLSEIGTKYWSSLLWSCLQNVLGKWPQFCLQSSPVHPRAGAGPFCGGGWTKMGYSLNHDNFYIAIFSSGFKNIGDWRGRGQGQQQGVARSRLICWADRNHILILEKLFVLQYQRKMSSFYFFVQPQSMGASFIPEELQGFYNTVNQNNSYSTQQFFITPNFNTTPLGFAELPCFPSQQDFMIPTSHSLPPVLNEAPEAREPKKRERNAEKQIQSAKKNSESNLINHYFSFFNSRQKSQKIVEACITSINSEKDSHKEKLLHLFYNTIHVVNARRGRRYVNKKNLLSLFEPEELLRAVPEIKERISKINEITIDELCEVFRRCCFSFYRTYSIDSILTSKRISCIAKEEHFRKRRKVVRAFFEKE